MADPTTYRPATSDIPTNPGVYRFLDEDKRVIYVGKAKNLRNRLTSYFQAPEKLHQRTRTMVYTACEVKWVVVNTELEALTLEYAWIKEYAPRFNVMYRDDKSYPYLAVTLAEAVPRVQITRSQHKRGNRYFGPYTKAWALRETLDNLLRVFPVRSCSAGVYKQAERSGRPCLNGYIDRCSAPCVGKISVDDHRALALELCHFVDGDSTRFIEAKRAEMLAASADLDFERAALLRDDIAALEAVNEKNAVVLADTVDADVFGMVADELEVSFQVFYVRAGRIRGQRGWISERVADADEAELVASLIQQVYGDRTPDLSPRVRQRTQAKSVDDLAHTSVSTIPREIWVPHLPGDHETLAQWLSEMKGSKVVLRRPQRGRSADLMKTVAVNAALAMKQHKSSLIGDITVRSQALEELTEHLNLPRAPLRIECYDISHTQGEEQVGSMVVFEDGLAKKSDYRHYIIRGEDGTGARDDTAAMHEVLTRRLARLDDEPTEEPRRFAYRPDLILVDGGLPQVNAAQKVIDECGKDIPVVGIAKRLEEIWIPGEPFPVIFPRNSPALHLLQRLRDESHRFAISHHRKRRGKALTVSALDEIPGVGPAVQKKLLATFRSLTQIKAATLEELQNAPGIGPVMAQKIYHHFHNPDLPR